MTPPAAAFVRAITPHIHVFAERLVFPEAPTWFDDRLWVSDIIAGGVFELRPDGRRLGHHLPERRGIGGMAVTSAGRLIASGRDLVDVFTATTVAERPDGATGLNDVGVSREGDLLVGVLNYRPLAGEQAVGGSIARLSQDRIEWAWGSDVTWPNGIGTLSDGTIVVADFADGVMRAHDGSAASSVIANSPSGHFDGLCVDVSDHIWVATGPGGALLRLDRDGHLVDRVGLPAEFVSSVCFSGDNPHRLFATVAGCSLASDGGGAVLTFDVDTPGAPLTAATI